MEMIKQCMLAGSDIPNLEDIKYPCYIQPKVDGLRCLAINGQAYSRKMKLIPNKHVQQVFSELNLNGFDGELMVDGGFNSVQSAIMSEDGTPDFYLVSYDMWDVEGGYSTRNTQLINAVERCGSSYVKLCPTEVVTTPQEAENALQRFIGEGFEGGIIRSIDGKYKQGRSTLKEGYLLKLKRFFDDEALVTGFEEKLTNTNTKEVDERGYAKRSSKKDGLVPAGTLGSLVVEWKGETFKIGSGFTDEQRQEIWDNKDKYLGKWITFQYQEVSDYNIPRFPTAKGWRSELDMGEAQ
jgi:DNA ligase-1